MADGCALDLDVLLPRQTTVAALGTPVGKRTWAFDAVAAGARVALRPLPEGAAPLEAALRQAAAARAARGRRARRGRAARGARGGGRSVSACCSSRTVWCCSHSQPRCFAALALYLLPGNAVSRLLYDSVVPIVLALPLLLVSLAVLAAGRAWVSAGRADRLRSGAAAPEPGSSAELDCRNGRSRRAPHPPRRLRLLGHPLVPRAPAGDRAAVKDYWEFDRLVTVSDPRGVPDLDALDRSTTGRS